jgi:hypothetical protein
MTRSLTSAQDAEIRKPVTAPAYFVEIMFSTPVRLSSRGTKEWAGQEWISRGITLQGLAFDVTSPQQKGNLLLQDYDNAVTAIILREGIAGRTVNVWKFYGDAPDTDDPVQIFAGAGDAVSMDEKSGGINMTLVQRGARELYAPRRYQTRANGFSILPVIGTRISFNGEYYKIERDRG